eukprot:scaffold1635_cov203-Isochrysis_galbana.AAC.4
MYGGGCVPAARQQWGVVRVEGRCGGAGRAATVGVGGGVGGRCRRRAAGHCRSVSDKYRKFLMLRVTLHKPFAMTAAIMFEEDAAIVRVARPAVRASACFNFNGE